MNRRKMLGATALVALVPFFPQVIAIAPKSKLTNIDAKNFKRFKLGDLEITVVSDGFIDMKPVQPNFAKGITPKLVNKLLEDNFRSTEAVPLGMQIMLIKKANKVIMIDSGLGKGLASTGLLQQALAEAGFIPSDISEIVLTHAHPDHIGGLVNASGNLAFPTANIHIAKIEYDFWNQKNPDFSKSALKDKPSYLAEIIKGIQQTLSIVKPKLIFFEQETILLDCIKLISAPGHTPGLTLMKVFSGDNELVHIADLIHSDVLQFPNPEWGFSGDTDTKKASSTRRSKLSQFAKDKTHILAYHLPWPGLGHIRAKSNGFEWIPDAFVSP